MVVQNLKKILQEKKIIDQLFMNIEIKVLKVLAN